MSQFLQLLAIMIWPAVALWAIHLLKDPLRAFLTSARLRKVKLFGVEIEVAGAELAEVLWENFDHYEITDPQLSFLAELSKAAAGLPKPGAEKGSPASKDDLRALRNMGLIRGNAATLTRSSQVFITPLGQFLVANAKTRGHGRGIDVKTADEDYP